MQHLGNRVRSIQRSIQITAGRLDFDPKRLFDPFRTHRRAFGPRLSEAPRWANLKIRPLEIDRLARILPDRATLDECGTASDGEARYLYDRRHHITWRRIFPYVYPGIRI